MQVEITVFNNVSAHCWAENNQPQGSVVLVGAGPGDAGLMIIKGCNNVSVDVVVYDRLVSDEVMHLVRRDAERIYVGKRAGFIVFLKRRLTKFLLITPRQEKGSEVKRGDPFILVEEVKS